METDIGNPIEYDPVIDPLNNENTEEVVQEDQRQYYNDYNMQVPQTFSPPPPPSEKTDFFSTIVKSTWIVVFVVFLLGFFMGKTMQPLILRYT